MKLAINGHPKTNTKSPLKKRLNSACSSANRARTSRGRGLVFIGIIPPHSQSMSRLAGYSKSQGDASSQRALPAVLVRQQLADTSDDGTVRAGHDDAGVAIVVPNQLAAAPARRHHDDGLIHFGGLGMAHRHDGLDPGLADIGDRPAGRHRLRSEER